ncbi:transcriptional repressor LexA [Aerococcus suis]|uniref:LexA repressor n=1 Tax=Aerococcus suis TaxID=371602 RepID=A0A1W1YBT2_9LACT|nr:transcriptional repressor LexA [Aerococcus suis]MCI7240227.1 transcriptional repressor LexA [Aerococcus suis]MDD7758678.1 transcriptional repressor LexA [Aerococcus suis]MDY4647109.1 transcriptional repressor LexA [Aerococcus suis]SMC33605.1 repressor LexA [Aerococcus suis]
MKARQQEILQFIYESVTEQGYPPTVREICQEVHLSSPSTVHGHISRLEANGYLFKDPTKPRAMEITQKGLAALNVKPEGIPIVGTVTAGEPITAVQNIEDTFPIPPSLANTDAELFMLKIRGESMINAGIFDGDYVIVRQQTSANNGEIVIAMTDEEEATCKTFYREDNHYRLQPENDTMEPIILNHVHILGKVVSLFRENIL